MPWGLKRFQQSGQTHFITFGCYHRHPSFHHGRGEAVARAFSTDSSDYNLCVYGYVVMPDHLTC